MSKRKSSDLRFCGCRMCRSGRRTKWGSWFVQHTRRRYRRHVKNLIDQGKYEEIPDRFPVEYTD